MSGNTREHIRNLVLILITTVIFIIQYYLISAGIYSGKAQNQIISFGFFSANGLIWCVVSGILWVAGLFGIPGYLNRIKNQKSIKLFYPGWLWILGTVVSVIAGIVAFYYCVGYQYISKGLRVSVFLRWNFSTALKLFQENSQFRLLCVVIISLLATELFVWVVECIISYGVSRKYTDQAKFELSARGSDRYLGTFLWLGLSVILLAFFYGNIFGERKIWLAVISTVLVFVFGLLWFIISFFGVLEEEMEWKKVICYVPFWNVPSFVIFFIWNTAICKKEFPESIVVVFKEIFILREINNVIEIVLFLTGLGVAAMISSFLALLFFHVLGMFMNLIEEISKTIKWYRKIESRIAELEKNDLSIDEPDYNLDKLINSNERHLLPRHLYLSFSSLDKLIGSKERRIARLNKEVYQYRKKQEEMEEQCKNLEKDKEQMEVKCRKLEREEEHLEREMTDLNDNHASILKKEQETNQKDDRNIQIYKDKLIEKGYQITQLREEKERLEEAVANLHNNLIKNENKVKEKDLQIAQLKKSLEDARIYTTEFAKELKRYREKTGELFSENEKHSTVEEDIRTEKKTSSEQTIHSGQKSNMFLPFDIILTIYGMDTEEKVEGFWSHMGMDGKDKAISQLDLDTLLGNIGIQTGLVLKGMDPVETAYGFKKAVNMSGDNIVSVKKQGDITCMQSVEPFNWVLLKGAYDVTVKVENQMEITCILELA